MTGDMLDLQAVDFWQTEDNDEDESNNQAIAESMKNKKFSA